MMNNDDNNNNNNDNYNAYSSSVNKPLGVPTHIARKRQYVPFQTGLVTPIDMNNNNNINNNMNNNNMNNNNNNNMINHELSVNSEVDHDNNSRSGNGGSGVGNMMQYLDNDGDINIPLSPIRSPGPHNHPNSNSNQHQKSSPSTGSTNTSVTNNNNEIPVLSSSTSYKNKDLRRSFAQAPMNRIGDDSRSHSQYIRDREIVIGVDNNNDSNTSDIHNNINTSGTRSISTSNANVNDHVNQSEGGVPLVNTVVPEPVNPRKTIRKSLFSKNIIAAHNNNDSSSGSSSSNNKGKGKGKRKQSILGAIFGYGAAEPTTSTPPSDNNNNTSTPPSDNNNTTTTPPSDNNNNTTTTNNYNDNDNSLVPPTIKEDDEDDPKPDEDSDVRVDNIDTTSAALTTPALHTTTPLSYSVPDLDLNINAFSSPGQMAGIISSNHDNDDNPGINVVDSSSPLSSQYNHNINMNMNDNHIVGDNSPSNETRVSQETVSTITTSRTNNRHSIMDGLSRMLGFKKRKTGLIEALNNLNYDDYASQGQSWQGSYPGGHLEGGHVSSSVSINTGMYSYDNASNITSTYNNTTGTGGPSILMLNTTDPHLLSPKDHIKTVKAKAQAETWQIKKQLALDEKQRIEDDEKRKVMERRFVMEERQKQKVEAEEMKRLKAIEIEAIKRKEFADRVTKKRQEEEYTEWSRRQDKYERIAEKTRQEEIRSKKLAERNEAKRKQIQEEEKERQKQIRIKAKEEKDAEKLRLMSFEEKREYYAKKAAREKEEAIIAAAIAAEEETKRKEEEKIRLEEEAKIAKEAAFQAEVERVKLTMLAEDERIRKEKEAEEIRIHKEKEAEEERIRKEKEAEEERIRKEKEAEEERIRKETEEKEARRLRFELSLEANERRIMTREDAVATSIRAYFTPKISKDRANVVMAAVIKKFRDNVTRKKRENKFGRDWIKMHGIKSVISTTNDFRNIADAIDMANYHSNLELAQMVTQRLNEKLFSEASLSIPPSENKDLTELLQYTSIPKIHGFMNCFINEKNIIYNFIDLLMLLTDYSVSCMHQMAEDQMIGTLFNFAMGAPERTKTDAAIKICKVISRIVQDSPTGKAFMCEQENATKLSQMLLKAMGSDAWVEAVLKILFYISFKNKNKLSILGRAGCVDATIQVMSTYAKKSKICGSALKCLITLTQADENNATIALSSAQIPRFVSTLKDLNNNQKLLTQLLILLCAYGRSSEILRNVLGDTEIPTILIGIAIIPSQDPDLVPIIIQAAAYMIPLTATDIMENITSLINVYESNQSATKEQMENISLAKSVLGARFSGEKDLRLVKKKTVSNTGKGKTKKEDTN